MLSSQVDAFTSQPFHGNAAAVVLMTPKEAACVSIELRQKIAAEMNLSETSFVEIIDDNVDNELERTFQNARCCQHLVTESQLSRPAA